MTKGVEEGVEEGEDGGFGGGFGGVFWCAKGIELIDEKAGWGGGGLTISPNRGDNENALLLYVVMKW